MERNLLREAIRKALLREFRVCPSNIEGTGLFPNSSIEPGERLFPLFNLVKDESYFKRRDQGLPVMWPDDVEWSDNTWHINHQKNSSCSIEWDGDVWYCVSNSPLTQDDEITLNYKDMPSFVDRDISGFIEVE